MNRMIKSLKAMNETLEKLLKKNSGWTETEKSDLPQTSLKEKETPKKKVVSRYPCCYETEDSKGPNFAAVFVNGIDTSLERDDIKSALIKHFGSCGVTRVFVPFECATGVPTGYAFINLEDKEKALTLSGSYMGGCKLEVMMTKHMVEYIGKNFSGCDRCRQAAIKARIDRFYQKHRPPPPGYLEALEARRKGEEAVSD